MEGAPQHKPHQSALEDFNSVRRKAAIQELISRMTGKENRLLSYSDVRSRLDGVETPYKELRDIPIDAIIGTVSRYDDFSRTLLPLKEEDERRWTKVRMWTESGWGLPPIDVFQVGEAYFILDGHHRASVARSIGASHIQAYVRQVTTRVQVSQTDQFEDILLKSEFTEFLKQTDLDKTRPAADLRVTRAGEYNRLLELISLHRYDLVVEYGGEVTFVDAATDWYDHIYLPIIAIIRERNLLRDFPDRTETDLYLWTIDHLQRLENEYGWPVEAGQAPYASDLQQHIKASKAGRFIRRMKRFIHRVSERSNTSPTHKNEFWTHIDRDDQGHLFSHIMVPLRGKPESWQAVELACIIAQREESFVGGLLVNISAAEQDENALRANFLRMCQISGIDGSLSIADSPEVDVLLERSAWADLIVLGLEKRRPLQMLSRLPKSARRMIEKRTVPVLFHHNGSSTQINSLMLAYDGEANSEPAIYLAAYLALNWKIPLTVSTFGGAAVLKRAENILGKYDGLEARWVPCTGEIPAVLPIEAEANQCDVILVGNLKSNRWMGKWFRGPIEKLIINSRRPVLYCP